MLCQTDLLWWEGQSEQLSWSCGDEKANSIMGIEIAGVALSVGTGLARCPQSPDTDTSYPELSGALAWVPKPVLASG